MPDTNTVKIGDVDYAFKRVNLATMKKHVEFLQVSGRAAHEGGEGKPPDMDAALKQMMQMAEIVYECIARAQPGFTEEQAKDLYEGPASGSLFDRLMQGLDQDSVSIAYARVMTGSGYVPSGEPTAEAIAA